jgi:PilZ domain
MQTAPPTTRRIQTTTPAADVDKRLHRRFALTLAGRFMRADKTEYPCDVVDVSAGGIALRAATGGELGIGEKVIVYLDRLGGLEGEVVRHIEGGFAIKLSVTQNKREKLAAQITWLLNEKDIDGASARRHDRIPVGNRSAMLTIAEGVVVPCLILDVSLSGASIALAVKPDVETEVKLGRLRAVVVRHHSEGVGLQFMEILDAATMRAYFS